MRLYRCLELLLCALPLFNFNAAPIADAQTNVATLYVVPPPKFPLAESNLKLKRRTQVGTFYDVVGRRSALYGYEHRGAEAWVHPMKLIDDFGLSFRIEGYPLAFQGSDILTHIEVRPEATIFTYTHAAFTVRQIVFAPLEQPGIVMLLDIDSTLPMIIGASFRPRLALAWAGGLMTGNLEWNKDERAYYLTEESKRFVGIIGSPFARDVSVQPYQEEPRDVPAEFRLEATPAQLRSQYIPIVIAGSTNMNAGVNPNADTPPLAKPLPSREQPFARLVATPSAREQAKQTYERLLQSIPTLYDRNACYYGQLESDTVQVETPDARLNRAFAWAKVGVDKGFATNPQLGTGLLAGFRTSGASERPGFAWFFGRDALWTSLALVSAGDFAGTRTALDFLKRFQRADGKIPHEISQSAALIPWFTDYPYAWASADATPLYVIVNADYFRATGDQSYLQANWESIKRAYQFTLATDTDGNGLVENSKFGHGWVEGGALYPPHEEIYLQGLWIEASRLVAELADVMNDASFARQARLNAERTSAATEQTYWLADKKFYAYATQLPRATALTAEPGANLERRQARLNELKDRRLYDENTVLPAVPLWWHTLDEERAQNEISHIGSSHLATDWGTRIITNESRLYDPLSYHYGSVWGLFTGWASVGAYSYGRPHVGYQALMANALISETDALGYVTELLSGDFYKSFGRSSHHQVWSEAMIVAPVLRGMLGLAASDAGRTLTFAPQLPADWNAVTVRGVSINTSRYDFALQRERGDRLTINVTRQSVATNNAIGDSARRKLSTSGASIANTRLVIAPAFPLDARITKVIVNNRPAKFDKQIEGDVQRIVVNIESAPATARIVFAGAQGTDVFNEASTPVVGDANHGLRIISSRAEGGRLKLVLEGRGGREYALGLRSSGWSVNVPPTIGGVRLVPDRNGASPQLVVAFPAATAANADDYVQREISLPMRPAPPAR